MNRILNRAEPPGGSVEKLARRETPLPQGHRGARRERIGGSGHRDIGSSGEEHRENSLTRHGTVNILGILRRALTPKPGLAFAQDDRTKKSGAGAEEIG